MTKSIKDFESLIEKGENPRGFTAQTANGTSHATGTGWNRDQPYTSEEVAPEGPWKAGRSNRTSE